uniref:Uncharacterized protein n=1 Tax=Anopheles atroparvus TaxID=41427 RepID=A0A182JJ79_ANOAO
MRYRTPANSFAARSSSSATYCFARGRGSRLGGFSVSIASSSSSFASAFSSSAISFICCLNFGIGMARFTSYARPISRMFCSGSFLGLGAAKQSVHISIMIISIIGTGSIDCEPHVKNRRVAADGWQELASPPVAVVMSSGPTPPDAPPHDCCGRLIGSLLLLPPAPPPLLLLLFGPTPPPPPDELAPPPPLPLPLPPSIEPLDDALDASSFGFLGLRMRFRLG